MSLYVGDHVTCIPHRYLRRVTYTGGCIDTVESPDDEHLIVRNM